jgi:hypothetical protein
MDFHLLGEIRGIEPIATNLSIRERKNLKSRFGGYRWVKSISLNCTGTRPMVWDGAR